MTSPRPTARPRAGAAAVLALSLLTLAACSDDPIPDAEPPTPASTSTSAPPPTITPEPEAATLVPAGTPETVASGLTTPWSVAVTDGTALVSERDTGIVREVVDGELRRVGEVPGVAARGEGGLLGIAVDADHLYAYVTTGDGNRVLRFPLEGEAGSFGLGSAEVVVEGIPAANIHNGGRLAFGPDGMLYITTGDAAQPDLAQDPRSLAGKILRVTGDGVVPDDNPFPGSPVWSLGHRNPQGIGWDATGTMFSSEFGQDTWDELNIIEPGANYGWPEVEGIGGDDRYVDPVQQWAPSEASPSGLAVIEGTVFVANLRGERLRAIPVADPATATEYYAGEFGRLRDAVSGPDGELWIVTSNTDRGAGGDDRVLRVPLREG